MASNKRILIVDDQQDLREQMAKLLSRSSKKSETVSLVRQMRSRLLGQQSQAELDSDDEPERGAYEVDTAAQGQEALEKVKRALEAKRPYSVMFLDMRMPPGWDGMETAKRIREADKLIEIVIMTAYADHDQETIAQTVGAPDRLLYIKKPFQSEEIFQFALCLTSKWAAEEDERLRKTWLEGLLRGMSRIKGIKSEKPEDICSSVLKSLLLFIGSQKGLIASQAGDKWSLIQASGLDNAEAISYISINSAKFSESRTAQSIGGKYILPLKREGFSALAIIYDCTPPNDPEWYKLLNLLVMTASEALCSAAAQEELRKGERAAALMQASEKIAALCLPALKNIRSGLQTPVSDAIEADVRSLETAISALSSFGSSKPVPPSGKVQLVNLLQSCKPEMKGIEVKLEVSGLSSAEALCPGEFVQDALKLLISGRAAAAKKAGSAILNVKIDLKPEGSTYKLSVEDDGPALTEALANKLFEPFSLEGMDGFGLVFPLARRLLKAAGIALNVDARQNGAFFNATIPAVQKA